MSAGTARSMEFERKSTVSTETITSSRILVVDQCRPKLKEVEGFQFLTKYWPKLRRLRLMIRVVYK